MDIKRAFEFYKVNPEEDQKITLCNDFKVVDIDNNDTLKIISLKDNKYYYVEDIYLTDNSDLWNPKDDDHYIIWEVPTIDPADIDFLIGCVKIKQNLNNN